MAISFVGSAEASAIDGANVTITLPAGMAAGDLVIVAYAIGDNDGVDHNMAMVTGGYTEVADLFANDAQDTHLGVFWKIMAAIPDTTATVDGLGGTDAAVAAVCMVFRGVDNTTPMDVTPTTATGLNTMHPNPPLIDYVTTSVWTVICVASGHTRGGTGTYTFPTGYTTNPIDCGSDDTNDVTVGMGYRTNPADPEDPGGLVHSGTDSTNFCWCAATLALRPASATGFSIDAQPGSYSTTGAAAEVPAGRMTDANPGSYAVSGVAAEVLSGRVVDAGPGSYALTGTAAEIFPSRVVDAGSGSYALSGATAETLAGRMVDASPGSYALAGVAAEVVSGRAIGADPGSYLLVGADTTLVGPAFIDAAPGSYILTGLDAGIVASKFLNAAPGNYSTSGFAAGVIGDFEIPSGLSTYVLTGFAAELVYVPVATGRAAIRRRLPLR